MPVEVGKHDALGIGKLERCAACTGATQHSPLAQLHLGSTSGQESLLGCRSRGLIYLTHVRPVRDLCFVLEPLPKGGGLESLILWRPNTMLDRLVGPRLIIPSLPKLRCPGWEAPRRFS